jgi:hypothetical protein
MRIHEGSHPILETAPQRVRLRERLRGEDPVHNGRNPVRGAGEEEYAAILGAAEPELTVAVERMGEIAWRPTEPSSILTPPIFMSMWMTAVSGDDDRHFAPSAAS